MKYNLPNKDGHGAGQTHLFLMDLDSDPNGLKFLTHT